MNKVHWQEGPVLAAKTDAARPILAVKVVQGIQFLQIFYQNQFDQTDFGVTDPPIQNSITYRIYPSKSRAHINSWARINTGVQYSEVNKRSCNIHINARLKIVYRK